MGSPGRRISDVFLAVLMLLAAALLSYGCDGSDDIVSEPPNSTSEDTTSPGPGERARGERLPSGTGGTSGRTLGPRPTEGEEAARPRDSRSKEAGTRALATEIESIARSYPGTYGVMVWQPAAGERVSVNATHSFEAASLAKLPVLLALYREAAEGGVNLDEKIRIRPSDIQPGTGVLQYQQPGTTLTLRECAYYLVSESDNTAWAIIERRLGEERIRAELESIGATSTNYEYAKNATTPEDVLKMLEYISDPGYTTPALSEEMLSAMTGTAFEDRLPKGVPPDAQVAHKTGILGDGFSDAGVVYPAGEKEEHYYIVVFSEGSPEASSRAAMREMSAAAYGALVEPTEEHLRNGVAQGYR